MNTKETIKEIYGSDYCISLEDLPKLREELENTNAQKLRGFIMKILVLLRLPQVQV